MRKDQLKREIDGLLQTYLDLGDNAAIIVREVKKTANADVRGKLIGELRNTDKKRIELLNQIDALSD
jgi:ribosomal protein L14